jgi:hypothetical protein
LHLDITERLTKQYSTVFGADNFVLLGNNKAVDRTALDPTKNYMQICSVEIYHGEEELEERSTSFKQNFDVARFMMETPFTKSGKAHGEIDEVHIL